MVKESISSFSTIISTDNHQKENMLSFHLQRIPKKLKPLSPFVSKLRFLLSNAKYTHAIHWSSDEKGVVITDADIFKKIILENDEEMFKTRNFTSFVRQLNLYGFRKVPSNGKSDPMSHMKFEHIYFRKERPDLMHLVHRTCFANRRRYSNVLSSSCSNFAKSLTPSIKSIKANVSMGPENPKRSLSLNTHNIFNSTRTPLGVSKLQNKNTNMEQNITISHEPSILDESTADTSMNSSFGDVDFQITSSQNICEHNYALPSTTCNKQQQQEFDEHSVYEYLNNNFNVEKEVVQTLLSFQQKELDNNMGGLRTLAEVSIILSQSAKQSDCTSHEETVIRSQCNATPMETLNSS